MNMMEGMFKRRETTTALDHIHNPELHLSYQVVDAIVREYQHGEIKNMLKFLQDNGSAFISHLQLIVQKDPQLVSGFEHAKTRQLWETVSYILGYYVRAPDSGKQAEASALLLHCGTIADESGESLVDAALHSAVGDLHAHSRPDFLSGSETSEQTSKRDAADVVLRELLSQWLAHYTTAGEDILQGWIDSSGHPKELLQALRRIERAKPGAITKLAQDYGVVNYARYPEAQLLRQVERHNDISSPYGLVIAARADHNGALLSGPDSIAHLAEQLDGWCESRIFEVSTKTELAARLAALAERQGPVNAQAQFGLIMAHGNSESIAFGRNRDGDDAVVTRDQLDDVVAVARERYLVPDATVIVSACETGRTGGIAETATKTLGINTIAPDFQAGVEDITVTVLPDGKLDFAVRYTGQKLFTKVARKYFAKRD